MNPLRPTITRMLLIALVVTVAGCGSDPAPTSVNLQSAPVLTADPGSSPAPGDAGGGGSAVLVIDEDSIDNGNLPNEFSDVDVNDQKADLGRRDPLAFFEANVGRSVDLFTGQMGDEGWFALKTIPGTWIAAGPTDNGTRNFLLAGPGLGSPDRDDDREALLDEIPNVTPLRATGLRMLVGQTVVAVVYDGDVGINYSPLLGSLKGATLGLVALEVLDVRRLTGYSTSSLPRVTVRILDVRTVADGPLALFANAPAPGSSSSPFDVRPPADVPGPRLVPAP